MTECVGGIDVRTPAAVTVTGFVAHQLGVAISGPLSADSGLATIDVTSTNITASDPQDNCNTSVLSLGASAFTLRDSTVDGGYYGLIAYNTGSVTIQNSTLRNQYIGILSAGKLQMIDTMITGTVSPVFLSGGTLSFTGVTMTGNATAIDLSGFSADAPLSLTMRRSTISGNNGDGIKLSGNVILDLGTATDPGANVIMGNTKVGLHVIDGPGQPQITAIGNTWNANVQDADDRGGYIEIATLTGPLATSPGNNFALVAGASLQR